MRVYALIDCNAFFCSCERICQPELKRVPVVVLSNNDGCVIARTSEAKEIGVPMGAPYFQYRDMLAQAGVAVRSSNFVLYADISNRVMQTIRDLVPALEVYSIDECWADLSGIQDVHTLGREIRTKLLKLVGMPTGVGISTTKTLTKLANWAAKKWPATGGVVDLTDPARQAKLLKIAPVSEVWGIGRRLSLKLGEIGIKTAHDLAYFDIGTIRRRFGVTVERTARELRGVDCLELLQGPPPKQMIGTSKMFGAKLYDLPSLRQALASYVTRAAEKLRSQHSVCGALQVSIQTQLHDPMKPRFSNATTITLANSTNDTRDILAAAMQGLESIYVSGHAYAKCSVLLMDLCPRGQTTTDLFAPAPRRGGEQLMEVMDAINASQGRGTVRLGAVPARSIWAARRDMVSHAYTTRWDQVIRVRG